MLIEVKFKIKKRVESFNLKGNWGRSFARCRRQLCGTERTKTCLPRTFSKVN